MMTLDELTTALAARANYYEREVQWPEQSLADFADAGVALVHSAILRR